MLSGNRTIVGKDSPTGVLSKSAPTDSRALAAPTRTIPRLKRYRDSTGTIAGGESRGWCSSLLGL
jgi:hypothetical protein